ncbi:MAG: GNAT family N-acetyltransferase [Bacteroidota bacterium]
MQVHIKTFDQLTKEELYALLRLRSEVFVVEQDCVYQDLDGKDDKALHVLGKKEDILVAYTRIFDAGDYFSEASIGRVVVDKEERKHRYGKEIMEASIRAVQHYFNTPTIVVSAQAYLIKFYGSLGFEQVGDGYLEDGIPHIRMFKKA